ncbi:MAG: ADOP family duplicated permease [Candidatus Acidiferrales bacterium]
MRLPLWRRKQKEELDEELGGHLGAAVRERMERGETRAEAEAAARRQFGNVELVKEVTRDVWGWRWLDALVRDLRYALRAMAARPGFTAVTILLLALGIGANTAIFSLWNGLLYASLPGVEKPEELVILTDPDESGRWTGLWEGRTDGPRAWLTYQEFEDLRDHADVFSAVMASQSGLGNWRVRVESNEWEEARGRFVSGGYFELLGVRPAIGRLFAASDDHTATPHAVISHSYWQRRFGGRADVHGKALTVEKAALTIIGVTPPGFIGETIGQRPDLWLPLRLQPSMQSDRDGLHDTPPVKTMWLHVFGRLKPGVTLAQAEAQANAIFRAGLESFYGAARIAARPDFLDQRLQVQPAARGASPTRSWFSGSLTALLAAAGTLLFIVCTNLANLLLARGVARRPEIALRLSLGASRNRLIRQLATESLTMAGLGGAAAITVAYFSHGALVRMLVVSSASFQMSFALDPLVLAFLVATTLAAALLFGILPAWQVAKTDAGEYLKELSQRAAGSKSQMRSGRFLVSLQLALSLPLLIGAGLLLRTVYNLQRIDLGFPAERLLMVRVDFREAGYEAARSGNAIRELLEEMQRIPNVQAASFSQLGVFGGGESSETIEVEGYTPQGGRERGSALDVVGPGYFSALGVPVLRGREILERDSGAALKVCVINESFAKQFFAHRNPIGMHIAIIGDDETRSTYQVVGVAANARTMSLRGDVAPRFFLAGMQLTSVTSPTMLIRTDRGTTPTMAAARKTIERMDPALPILSAVSIEEKMAELTAQDRTTAQLAVVFGCVAVTLAAIGLYGLLSYGVARRAGEIAIRIALGAQPRRVIAMILRETSGLLIGGLALGGGLAYAASRLIESQLYGVAPEDPLTLALAIGLLLLVALGAAYLPAKRAASIDPMAALRHQ